MPWKKAWPTELKEKLKAMGLSDNDIRTLEGYGSVAKLKTSPVYRALDEARMREMLADLTRFDVEMPG
jgi:hypothetical protein